MFAVIIPAGGSGTRLGGEKKQFRLLDGLSVLFRTISRFIDFPEITQIIIALPKTDLTAAKLEITAHFSQKVQCCAGGSSRQASVFNALQYLSADIRFVLVHDAVRPFLRKQDIRQLIAEVPQKLALSPVLAVADTLRKGENGFLQETVDRNGLFRMQTPQAFEKNLLLKAHKQAISDDFEGTDDCELLQRIGQEIHYLNGFPLNIKITTQQDWEIAETLWQIVHSTD